MAAPFLDVMAGMRRAANLTQAALADRMGTTQSAVARWESGAVSPRLVSVLRVARACGFEPRVTWTLLDDDVDRSQIRERLRWTPSERLRYLLDMLDFEARARRARPVARPT